jgi:hypothetical protein
MPPLCCQKCDLLGIALPIGIDLAPPEVWSRFWQAEQMARMAMPETPVHKNDSPVARQNNIRTPGQTGTT